MAEGVRWWDIYALEELGCSEHTMDIFLATHDPNGNFYPTMGQWIDHCKLQDMHPFFAGNRMPVTREGMNKLLLVEQDLLRRTCRKYGKSWWKGRERDYELYRQFSQDLRKLISFIPYEEVRQYESQKRGYQTMPRTASYNSNAALYMTRARVDWRKAKQEVKGSFFAGFVPRTVPGRKGRRRYRLKDVSSVIYPERGTEDGNSLAKKSGRPYQSGPAAFLSEVGSRFMRFMLGGRPVSWGKNRLPGYGDDIWRLTHWPDGRPCPNVKEWFDWCRTSNVHPSEKGRDCDFSDLGFCLWFRQFERSEMDKAEKLWEGHTSLSVLSESALAHDKVWPLPEGKKRQYGQLHVEPYLQSESKLSFPNIASLFGKRMDEIVNVRHRQRRMGLERFARQVVFSARRRASLIIEHNQDSPQLDMGNRPYGKIYRKGDFGL